MSEKSFLLLEVSFLNIMIIQYNYHSLRLWLQFGILAIHYSFSKHYFLSIHASNDIGEYPLVKVSFKNSNENSNEMKFWADIGPRKSQEYNALDDKSKSCCLF